MPASAQQRTPNVTPRRHESDPQHSAAVAQLPWTGEHTHEPAPKLHVPPQLLPLGPPEVPCTQLLVAEHQPQPPIEVHVPQLVAPAQGFGAGHCEVSQRQSHEPTSGPVPVPRRQVLVSAHQPQSSSPVQPPHVVCAPQSLPPPHSLPSQLQSLHEPVVGPPEVPRWHVPVSPHQPQLARPVHSPQSAALTHGSGAPGHELESQLQLEHEPVLGPVDVPVLHRPVSAHQPHG